MTVKQFFLGLLHLQNGGGIKSIKALKFQLILQYFDFNLC